MTRTEFEALDAVYYDACDGETLEHETVAEAVAERLDGWVEPGCDMLARLRAHSPVEVRAWRRDVVEESWIDAAARSVLEDLRERFTNDFGDPDDAIDYDDIGASLTTMRAAVAEFVARGTVWAYEEAACYRYSAEEVEAMMREHQPEWFETAVAVEP